MPDGADVQVALLTPADADGGLDAPALATHVRWLRTRGVDGLMVAGTTGEGPLLDEDEVIEVLACCSEAAEGELELVAHVGRPSTRATVRLALAAREAGAAAVAAVVPYFYGYEDDQLLRHFTAVADAVAPLPLIAYTIPVRTHNELSPELLERLAGAGVAGVKDSSKSFSLHREYLDVARRHGMRIYMGSDGLALQALEAGATGLMSAVANVFPEQVVGLRDAVASGQAERAQQLQDEILAFRAQAATRRPMVALKEQLSARLRAEGESYPQRIRLPLG
jgi:dihydrodipicolinate synthase/N-acetylneuraminate lyase